MRYAATVFEVGNCGECEFAGEYEEHPDQCTKMKRAINLWERIPEWCPLAKTEDDALDAEKARRRG